jgi:hypothetical protein
MVNSGPHTNQSQFMITLKAIPYFDYKYVAFGRVVDGMKLIQKMESTPLTNERPNANIRIVAGGVLYAPMDALEQAAQREKKNATRPRDSAHVLGDPQVPKGLEKADELLQPTSDLKLDGLSDLKLEGDDSSNFDDASNPKTPNLD